MDNLSAFLALARRPIDQMTAEDWARFYELRDLLCAEYHWWTLSQRVHADDLAQARIDRLANEAQPELFG